MTRANFIFIWKFLFLFTVGLFIFFGWEFGLASIFSIIFLLVLGNVWEKHQNKRFDKKSLYSKLLHDNSYGNSDWGRFRIKFYIYHYNFQTDEEVKAFGYKIINAYINYNPLLKNEWVEDCPNDDKGALIAEIGAPVLSHKFLPYSNIEMPVEQCWKSLNLDRLCKKETANVWYGKY